MILLYASPRGGTRSTNRSKLNVLFPPPTEQNRGMELVINLPANLELKLRQCAAEAGSHSL